MTPGSPPGGLDLLVVGALTVDHFADGTTAPGGTVLHATRAAVAARHQVGVVTIAGPEPDVAAGLDEMGSLAAWVAVQVTESSVAFRHREEGDARDLVSLARPPDSLRLPPEMPTPRALLFAPVAGELDAAVLGSQAKLRGAILQGWLRHLRPGEPVTPLHLRYLPGAVRVALGQLDLVVASRDDLLAVASEPAQQLDALRAALGSHPALVVTIGSSGLWLSHGRESGHRPAPRVVTGRPTVGAGDMLAALMLVELPGAGPQVAAERAMQAVAQLLSARRPFPG